MEVGFIFGLYLGSEEESLRLPPTLVYHKTLWHSPCSTVEGWGVGRIFFAGLWCNSKQLIKAGMQVRDLLSLKEYFLPHLRCGCISTDYQTGSRERKGRLSSESSRTCFNTKYLIDFCRHQRTSSKRSWREGRWDTEGISWCSNLRSNPDASSILGLRQAEMYLCTISLPSKLMMLYGYIKRFKSGSFIETRF